jgi:GR25 family glycosyltransferase involved in LPS biosynthesis
MITIGITYYPNKSLFYSGLNQTAILLAELLSKYCNIILLHPNSESVWWDNFPLLPNIKLENIYTATKLDWLIDIDGLISGHYRQKIAKKTIVFMRTFLQFSEMDRSVYIELPYESRSMEAIDEIWCWDILNAPETIPSIQTLYPCPIRRVPFIWSSTIIDFFSKKQLASFNPDQNEWSIHISEKNTNESSCILPLVAIRELTLQNTISAKYYIHNIQDIKDNKFLKENILHNIESEKLPILFSEKVPYYDYLQSSNALFFSHSRFVSLRLSLLQLLWMGIPVIHNSPILEKLHPSLSMLYYKGNHISEILSSFTKFKINPNQWYNSIQDIRQSIMNEFHSTTRLNEWSSIYSTYLNKENKVSDIVISKELEIKDVKVLFMVGFVDMWDGFNYNNNFIIDAIRNKVPKWNVTGILYDVSVKEKPNLLIVGPYGKKWEMIDKTIPKVYFSAENQNVSHWKVPEDSSFQLYVTSSREEDSNHIRIPVWATFIDWYTSSTEFPKQSNDNPIRIPFYFTMNSHKVPFDVRNEFCGFVVSNPICEFRNHTFFAVNEYKKVNSGGSLYNNIGSQLHLKYPGGGSGDISKYDFFTKHKFTISFENSQSSGYITEKVLHSKIAGCVPIYWGDKDTTSDFVPNSFINVSNIQDPNMIVQIIKKLELNPEYCKKIASTPILDEERKQKMLKQISKMAEKLISIGYPAFKNIDIGQVEILENKLEKDYKEQVEISENKLEKDYKEQVEISENKLEKDYKEQVEISENKSEEDHKGQVEILEDKLKEDHKEQVVISENKSEEDHKGQVEILEDKLKEDHKEQVVISENKSEEDHKEQVVISENKSEEDYKEQVEIKKDEWEGIDKIYVINLDRRKDRWEKLIKEESHLSSDKLVRISGVDGNTLTLTPSIYKLFRKNTFEWKKGVIGCNLSHLKTWMEIQKENGKYFLVLEDDVRFDKDRIQLWKNAVKYIPDDADLLYLGGVLPPNKIALPQASIAINEYWSELIPNYFFSKIPLPIFHFCAYSYILTKQGVKKILDHIMYSDDKYFTISDQLLGNMVLNLKKYFINPLMTYCFQEKDPEYIHSDFNKLQREVKYDSDLWNNKDCFTEEELSIYDEDKLMKLYYCSDSEGDHISLQMYEKDWLQQLFNKTFDLQLFKDTNEYLPNTWFLVQRPFLHHWNQFFIKLNHNKIPFKVIHISDEFGKDDISFYHLEYCKTVIRNYKYDHIPSLSHIITVPLGYHHLFKGDKKSWKERELVWSFHGTNWFGRDKELELFTKFVPHNCRLFPNWNHPTQTKEKDYLSTLSNSKFCPILKGNNTETFRFYEALESGVLPLTTIKDSTYIQWIEENMKLSELYNWTNPEEVLNKMEITEEIYNKVMKRWTNWKNKLKNQCKLL